jgi:type I restriction enzyme S subunit
VSEVVADRSERWEVKPLSDLADAIQYGYTAKAKTDAAGIRYLRITDIQDDHVEWSTVPSCDVSEAESKKYLLAAGDLVFARTGATVGKSFLIRGNIPKSVFASYLIRVRLRKHVDPRYVAHFFQSPSYWNQIAESSAGIGQPNVNGKKLAQIQIPVAPPQQQIEIVAELEKQFSRLDEAVANLQRVKANLKRYKASVLKAAVEGRLVETEATLARREGRAYETGEQLLQRILEERRTKWSGRGKWKAPEPTTTEATLPDGWTWASVDQLADVGTGATPKRDKAAYWNDGDVPWVTSSVVNGAYVDQASEFVTKLALAETNLTLYPIGTLLIAMYGEGKTRGKCTELRIPASTNQALAALQVDSSIRGYLRHFLELNYEEMRKFASGGVQPNLNLGLVRAVCVPLPPLAEQTRIVAEVDRHLSIILEVEAEVDANLQRAQALRQATLTKAYAIGSE